MKKIIIVRSIFFSVLLILLAGCSIGKQIDEYNNVPVCYNGIFTSNTSGINRSEDGYLYGFKWQCVEFVKRYYYQKLNHKMPNVYGNAKDFFNIKLNDGKMNKERGLVQYKNGGESRPCVDDLIIFNDTEFGHAAIITRVDEESIEVIQQNVWIITRRKYDLEFKDGYYLINNNDPGNPAGWLRKQ